MCERCAELEERVAWLESELGIQGAAQRSRLLREALRDERGHRCRGGASLLAALYDAQGRPLNRQQLLDSLPTLDGQVDRCAKVVDVYVCVIRKTLGQGIISTVFGHGYRITEAGSEMVAAILGEAAKPLPENVAA
jgi:hypothetical protein